MDVLGDFEAYIEYYTAVSGGRWPVLLVVVLVGIIVLLLIVILVFVLYGRSLAEKSRLKKLVAERTQALEMETAILNTVFDSIPDILFCKNVDLTHIKVNHAFAEAFNISKEDVQGKIENDFLNVPDDVIEHWHMWDRRVIEEQMQYIVEDEVPLPNGKTRIYESIKVPLTFEGKPTGLVGLARDITKRKEMEREILAASSAKSAFIANMSHEIRTPMNSIIGFSELALEEEMSIKAQTYLHRIMESSKWLLQIINDILDISKIESGKVELEKVPFKIGDIIASCQSIIYPNATEKGIRLHFHVDPSDRLLIGDPIRMRQIFTNLTANAVKFTPQGNVKVSAKIADSTENTQTIYCEITDTGIGMTPEQIQRIAEPFMQADVSITRKFGGTGLGVSIVAKLVELMGGELEIESKIGEGSRFSFQIKFDTIEAAEMKGMTTLVGQGKPTFCGDVLVCEDNKMNQIVISDHLLRVGLTAVIAENGQIGVNLVKEREDNPFDLILMDIHMPVMDGLVATQTIIEMGCPTPIVALTANVMSVDQEVYKQHGILDFIGKPFTSQELWSCLVKYLRIADKPIEASDQDLLSQLRESFLRENYNKYNEIIESLSQGDDKLTHRLVHSLKGTAGLIGEDGLHFIAAETESLLNEGRTVPDEKWRRLEEELTRILQSLEPLVGIEEQNAHSRVEKSPEEVNELFNQLEPLLITKSPKCLDYINDLHDVPGAEELASLIQTYDFRPALQVLTKLKENWRLA